MSFINSKICRVPWFLVLILILSLILQLLTLFWGLPLNNSTAFAYDEIVCANVILKMIYQSTLNPGWFIEGSGQLYLSLLPTYFFILVDKVTLVNVVLAERIISTIFLLFTIIVTYFIGEELLNEKLGLIAAFFLSINPYFFYVNTSGKQDSIVTFFVILSLLLLILYWKRNDVKYLYIASFTGGLAASSKYIGGLMLIFIAGLLAYQLIKFDKKTKLFMKSILSIIFFGIGFVILTPYSVITPDAFLKGSIGEFTHYQTSHGGIGQQHFYELLLDLSGASYWKSVPGMPILLVFSIIGVILFLMVKNIVNQREVGYLILLWGMLVLCTFSFFFKIKLWNQSVMAVPAMMIFAALPLYLLVSSKMKSMQCIGIVLILLTVPSLGMVIDHRLNDNRYLVADWLSENVESDDSIGVTSYVYFPHSLKNQTIGEDPNSVDDLNFKNTTYFVASSNYYDRYLRFKEDFPEKSNFYWTIVDTDSGSTVGNYSVLKRFPDKDTSYLSSISRMLSNYKGEVEIIILKRNNA